MTSTHARNESCLILSHFLIREAEKEVQDWFQALLSTEFTKPLPSIIQDGSILCKVANAIQPGAIPVIHENTLDISLHRENILNFLKFCAACRVNDFDLFQPENVLEGSDYPSVLYCLQDLGR